MGCERLMIRKCELLMREIFSRRVFNRSEDMSDEMKNRTLNT